jgi:hypothetical protein
MSSHFAQASGARKTGRVARRRRVDVTPATIMTRSDVAIVLIPAGL